MEDGVTIREIAIWTLTKHRDAVGEHLDLSDEELQNLFRRLCEDQMTLAEVRKRRMA